MYSLALRKKEYQNCTLNLHGGTIWWCIGLIKCPRSFGTLYPVFSNTVSTKRKYTLSYTFSFTFPLLPKTGCQRRFVLVSPSFKKWVLVNVIARFWLLNMNKNSKANKNASCWSIIKSKLLIICWLNLHELQDEWMGKKDDLISDMKGYENENDLSKGLVISLTAPWWP